MKFKIKKHLYCSISIIGVILVCIMNVSAAADVTSGSLEYNGKPSSEAFERSESGKDISKLKLENVPRELALNSYLANAGDKNSKQPKAVGIDTFGADNLASFTTINDNGSKSMYLFADPVKYVDKKTNEIKFIDNSMKKLGFLDGLLSRTAYENTENDIKVSLPKKISDGVVLAKDDYELKMIPKTEKSARAEKKDFLFNDEMYQVVEYEDAIDDGIHLQYAAVNSGVKENLIIDQYTGMNEFLYVVEAKGMVPEKSEGASIVLLDEKSKEPVMSFSQPWVQDSFDEEGNTRLTQDCSYKIEAIDKDSYLLTMIIDKAFLESPDTVYPVLVDPNTVAFLGSVHEINYVTYFKNQSEKWVNTPYNCFGNFTNSNGTYYGETLFLIRPVTILYDHINPTKITNVQLTMKQTLSYGSYYLNLYDSNTSTAHVSLNYNTLNSNVGAYQSQTECTNTNKNYSFDMTSLFKKWMTCFMAEPGGKSAGYGAILRAASTGKQTKQFQCNSNNLYISITFTEDTTLTTTSGVYFIKNAASGKYMTAEMTPHSGGNVGEYDFNGGTNQQWSVAYQGNGFYKLYSMYGPTNSLCLDITNNNADVWENIPSISDDFFSFRIIKCNDGTSSYRIMNTRTTGDNTKALGGNGSNIYQWTYGANNNQKWLFEPANWGDAWAFRNLPAGNPNCYGYALKLNSTPSLAMNYGDSVETVATRVETYVRSLGRSIRRISGPTATINANEYRFCMRVGNHSNRNPNRDYHFWVQTNTGAWSEKNGTAKVFRQPFYENPSTANWNMPYTDGSIAYINYYNSSTIYFAATWR